MRSTRQDTFREALLMNLCFSSSRAEGRWRGTHTKDRHVLLKHTFTMALCAHVNTHVCTSNNHTHTHMGLLLYIQQVLALGATSSVTLSYFSHTTEMYMVSQADRVPETTITDNDSALISVTNAATY